MLTQLQYLNLFHIIIVAPVILYVALSLLNGTQINPVWFTFLLLIGLAALTYHGYRFLASST